MRTHHASFVEKTFVVCDRFCMLLQNVFSSKILLLYSADSIIMVLGRLARNLGYLVATASEMQRAASLMGPRCSLQSELTFHSRRMPEVDALGMLTELSCPRRSFTA